MGPHCSCSGELQLPVLAWARAVVNLAAQVSFVCVFGSTEFKQSGKWATLFVQLVGFPAAASTAVALTLGAHEYVAR